MADRGKLEGRITIPASTTITVQGNNDISPVNVTIPAGTYYMSSAGSGSNDLPAEFASQATTQSSDTWTCTISAGEGGTGKITLDCNNDPYSVTWNGTTNGGYLRDVMGFTANISSVSAAQTGGNQAKYLWLPDGPMVTPFGDAVPRRETDFRQVMSAAGHVHTLYGQRRAIYSARWRCSRNLVHANEETTTNQSWEQFWLDCILGEDPFATTGGPLRLYWDADTDATYVTVVPMGEQVSVLDPSKVVADYVGLYDIALDRLVEVPS